MRTIIIATSTLLAGFLAGCDQPAPKTPPPAKSDIEIKAPGVDIKIDKEKEAERMWTSKPPVPM